MAGTLLKILTLHKTWAMAWGCLLSTLHALLMTKENMSWQDSLDSFENKSLFLIDLVGENDVIQNTNDYL